VCRQSIRLLRPGRRRGGCSVTSRFSLLIVLLLGHITRLAAKQASATLRLRSFLASRAARVPQLCSALIGESGV
jgi:hypothetical protein